MSDLPAVTFDPTNATAFMSSPLQACGSNIATQNLPGVIIDPAFELNVRNALAPDATARAVFAQYDRVCFAYQVPASAIPLLGAALQSVSTANMVLTYSRLFETNAASIGFSGTVPIASKAISFAAAVNVPSAYGNPFIYDTSGTFDMVMAIDASSVTLANLLSTFQTSDTSRNAVLPVSSDVGSWVDNVLNSVKIRYVSTILTAQPFGKSPVPPKVNYMLISTEIAPTNGWRLNDQIVIQNVQVDVVYDPVSSYGWGSIIKSNVTIGTQAVQLKVQYFLPGTSGSAAFLGSISATNLDVQALFVALTGNNALANLPISELMPELATLDAQIEMTGPPSSMSLSACILKTRLASSITISSQISLAGLQVDFSMRRSASAQPWVLQAIAQGKFVSTAGASEPVVIQFAKASTGSSITVGFADASLMTLQNLLTQFGVTSLGQQVLPPGLPSIDLLLMLQMQEVAIQYQSATAISTGFESISLSVVLPPASYQLLPGIALLQANVIVGVAFPFKSGGLQFMFDGIGQLGPASNPVPVSIQITRPFPNVGISTSAAITFTEQPLTVPLLLQKLNGDKPVTIPDFPLSGLAIRGISTTWGSLLTVKAQSLVQFDFTTANTVLDFLKLTNVVGAVAVTDYMDGTRKFGIQVSGNWAVAGAPLNVSISLMSGIWTLTVVDPQPIQLADAVKLLGTSPGSLGSDVTLYLPSINKILISGGTIVLQIPISSGATALKLKGEVDVADVNAVNVTAEVIVGTAGNGGGAFFDLGLAFSISQLSHTLQSLIGVSTQFPSFLGATEFGLLVSTSSAPPALAFDLTAFSSALGTSSVAPMRQGLMMSLHLKGADCSSATGVSHDFCSVLSSIFPPGSDTYAIVTFGKNPLATFQLILSSALHIWLSKDVTLDVGPISLGVSIPSTGPPSFFLSGAAGLTVCRNPYDFVLLVSVGPGGLLMGLSMPVGEVITIALPNPIPQLSISNVVFAFETSPSTTATIAAQADISIAATNGAGRISAFGELGMTADLEVKYIAAQVPKVTIEELVGVIMQIDIKALPPFITQIDLAQGLNMSYSELGFSGDGVMKPIDSGIHYHGFVNMAPWLPIPDVKLGVYVNVDMTWPPTTLGIRGNMSLALPPTNLANVLLIYRRKGDSLNGPIIAFEFDVGVRGIQFDLEFDAYVLLQAGPARLAEASAHLVFNTEELNLDFSVGLGPFPNLDISVECTWAYACNWNWQALLDNIGKIGELVLHDIEAGVQDVMAGIGTAVAAVEQFGKSVADKAVQIMSSLAYQLGDPNSPFRKICELAWNHVTALADVIGQGLENFGENLVKELAPLINTVKSGFVNFEHALEALGHDIAELGNDIVGVFKKVFGRDEMQSISGVNYTGPMPFRIPDRSHWTLTRRDACATNTTQCAYTSRAAFYLGYGCRIDSKQTCMVGCFQMNSTANCIDCKCASACIEATCASTMSILYDRMQNTTSLVKNVNTYAKTSLKDASVKKVAVVNQPLTGSTLLGKVNVAVSTGPGKSPGGAVASNTYAMDIQDAADISHQLVRATTDARFAGSPYDSNTMSALASTVEPPQGRKIIGYFPNWWGYVNPPVDFTNSVKYITHATYAFATVSYTKDLDRYYVDLTDPWADFHGVAADPNTGVIPNCMVATNLLSSCNGQYFVNIAPYLGYGAGAESCAALSCQNVKSDKCYTKLAFDAYLAINWANNDAYICGYMNTLIKGKQQGVKAILSIGGWYDSNFFSQATDPKHLTDFVKSIVAQVMLLGWDGVDIDWEYPGYEHGIPDGDSVYDCAVADACTKNRANDQVQYVQLLQALKTSLPPYKEISIAAPTGPSQVKKLHAKDICDTASHINLMAYDINGAWSPLVNHHALLYDRQPNVTLRWGVDDAVQLYLAAGCASTSLVLGVPFYGRGFSNVDPGPDPNRPGLYSTHSNNLANFEAQAWSYAQIKTALTSNTGWTEYYDADAVAAYMYNPVQRTLVSYDNPASLRAKAAYSRKHGLGGLMYWMMGQDTPNNELLLAMSTALNAAQ
ncbi:hypothetical protein HDU89_008583 [Geranomyces variabilis]|nr:hypothetical protein HDU89_008583 [Geranomyces variabilis]